MVAPPPYIVNGHSKSMSYDQYLVSLAHEDNKEALADEYAYRLDDLGNVFIAGETEELDFYDISDAYLDINDDVMHDITYTIKDDMGIEGSDLIYSLKDMNQDVLLAGTSTVDYDVLHATGEYVEEGGLDAERDAFETAYMDKHMAQAEEIFNATGEEVMKHNRESLASPAYEEYREAEDCKRNSVLGAGYAAPHMPMTTESATRAFEKLDRDKDEAIALDPDRADDITARYEDLVDFCSDAWGDVGVDVATAQLNAGFNRNAEQGHIVRNLSAEGLESRSAAEVAREAAEYEDTAEAESTEAETETPEAETSEPEIMQGEELDNYVADLKSRLAESRQQKREEAGLSMSKDEVAAAYEDPRFAELKRYTEQRRGEKIGPDKDQDAGLELQKNNPSCVLAHEGLFLLVLYTIAVRGR